MSKLAPKKHAERAGVEINNTNPGDIKVERTAKQEEEFLKRKREIIEKSEF